MEFDRIPEIAKYLSLVFFMAWLGRSTVWNFLPIFIENHVSSVFLVGIITSLPAAIPIVLDIPVGNLVQRAGEKIVIFLGLLTAIFPPILYLTAIPLAIVAGKAVEGVAKSLVFNGSWSLSLKTADEAVESESISIFLLGLNLAIIVGPVIGGYLIASRGFSLVFGLWVFTSVLAVMVFLSYIGLEGKRGFVDSLKDLFHRDTYSNDWHHLKENWSQIKLPYILIFLHSVIFSFYWLAVPLLLEEIGAGFATMGLIFGFAALPKAFQFLFGDIADRNGQIKTVMVLSVLLVPFLAAMNFVEETMMVGALFFLARLFTSGLSPALHAFFDQRCPEEVESELTGFLEFFKHSGQTIGPVMAGTAASIWSLNASFLAASLIAVMMLLVSAYSYF